MRAVKSGDTKPEMIVRRLVHGLGYRYRLHDRALPGAPDLVLPRLRGAVILVQRLFLASTPLQSGPIDAGHAS